jgi:aspartate/methionine/tyrosine aminotransferase
VTFSEIDYITWAKSLPAARINLARSGVAPCPASLLGVRASSLPVNLPVKYGYAPLLSAIAKRYRVTPDRVFTVSGGTTLANFVACAAALHGAERGAEVIVERPAYEPLLRATEALGARVRRLDRSFREGWRIDLRRLEKVVTTRTRLAIVTNLHNPSGARIDAETLASMARILAGAGAYLLVDEVYLECLFTATRTASSVHAGANVIVTNSLTKAYGLDGLRAGWLLGPADVVRRAGLIFDVIGGNGVAPGEQMALAAFRRMAVISRRSRAILGGNLQVMRRFLATERRLRAILPEGGNVLFAKLPRGLDDEPLAAHLRDRYSTLLVPGRFFESPGFVRLSFGCEAAVLERGLANVSRALNDLRQARA